MRCRENGRGQTDSAAVRRPEQTVSAMLASTKHLHQEHAVGVAEQRTFASLSMHRPPRRESTLSHCACVYTSTLFTYAGTQTWGQEGLVGGCCGPGGAHRSIAVVQRGNNQGHTQNTQAHASILNKEWARGAAGDWTWQAFIVGGATRSSQLVPVIWPRFMTNHTQLA